MVNAVASFAPKRRIWKYQHYLGVLAWRLFAFFTTTFFEIAVFIIANNVSAKNKRETVWYYGEQKFNQPNWTHLLRGKSKKYTLSDSEHDAWQPYSQSSLTRLRE